MALVFFLLFLSTLTWTNCENGFNDYAFCKEYCETENTKYLKDYCPNTCICLDNWIDSKIEHGTGVTKVNNEWKKYE